MKCVVRLRTEYWHDKNGAFFKQSLRVLKRLSKGHNLLHDDCMNSGAESVFPKIINLTECEDGIYVLMPVNESRDWESGYIVDYDYKLIPETPK